MEQNKEVADTEVSRLREQLAAQQQAAATSATAHEVGIRETGGGYRVDCKTCGDWALFADMNSDRAEDWKDAHSRIIAGAREIEEARILANAKLPISSLSDRELLEEQVYMTRALWSMVAEFQKGGMGKMFAGMLPSMLGPKR